MTVHITIERDDHEVVVYMCEEDFFTFVHDLEIRQDQLENMPGVVRGARPTLHRVYTAVSAFIEEARKLMHA